MRVTRKQRRARERKKRLLASGKQWLTKVGASAAAAVLSLAIGLTNPAKAMPQNGQVTAGTGAITQNANVMTVKQQTDKMAVNWQSFNIAAGEKVQFVQPSASSVALNRVVGNDPSAIYGQLSANGKVFLVNQNGIYFSPTAQVDVGGIVASTLNIKDSDFMNGKYIFNKTGNVSGTVLNQGSIRTSDGGYVALLGDKVTNEGVIVANKGSVALASGSGMTLDFTGDGLINLNVDQGAVNSLVANKNLVQADGGLVVMTARSADALIDTVVNNSGIVQARSIQNVNGVIRLDGGPASTVNVSGTLDASGMDAGQTGGTVKVLGNTINVTNARVDASGDKGGGTVLIGGNYQGRGPEQNAANTTVSQDVTIKADAVTEGKGGTVVVWSDGTTKFDGTISAQGGSLSGDGGSVETSGKILDIDAGVSVKAGAANGKGGEWLLDPYNYLVDTTAKAKQISDTLDTGTSVTISTATSTATVKDGTLSGTTGDGDITISSAITKAAGTDATLTLRADRSIYINSNITSSSNKLNITLSAANATNATVGGVDVNANLTSNGGNIFIGGGTGDVTNGIGFARNIDANSPAVAIEAGKSITSDGGNITINGHSSATAGNLNSGEPISGLYIKALANTSTSIVSGAGDIFLNGRSSASKNVNGINFQFTSGSVTTVGTSPSAGRINLNAVNDVNVESALSMLNFGNREQIIFKSPSVADWFIKLNGSPSAVDYVRDTTKSVPSYPNVGYLQVIGPNNSILYATYNTVNLATRAIYVYSGDGSKTYDGTMSATGLSPLAVGGNSGVLPTDFNVKTSLGTLSYTTASKNAGTYLTLTRTSTNISTFTSSDTYTYAIGYYNTGTYTINPKPITVSGITAANKVYDGGVTATVSTTGAAFNGMVSGDTLTVSSSGTFATKNVGTGKTVTLSSTYGGTDVGNYTITGQSSTTANITAKPLTITGLSVSNKVYDGTTTATLSGTGSLSGVVSGDTATLGGSATAAFADANAGNSKSVTISGLSLSGTDAGNYSINGSGSVTANITPATLTVTANDASKTYDKAAYSGGNGVTYSGFVNGETSAVLGGSLTYGGTSQNAVNAGSYTIVPSGLSSGNYTIGYANGTLTINKISLIPIVSNKVYDGTKTAAVTATGVLSGDEVILSGSGEFSSANVGSYSGISINSITLSGASAGNYSLSSTSASAASASITRAPLTITADNKSRVYGNSNPTLTASYTGLKGSDTSAVVSGLTLSTTAADTSGVGSYAISASGGTADNYTITHNDGTLSITRRSVTVTANANQSKVYGEDNPTYTYTASTGSAGTGIGLVNGDTLTGTLIREEGETYKPLGYALGQGGVTNANNANYDISFVSATFNITKRPITVTAATNTKVYDGTTSSVKLPTITSGTLANNSKLGISDMVTLSQNYDTKDAGSGKTLTPHAAISTGIGNYNIIYIKSTGDITPKALTMSGLSVPSSKVYDGTTAAVVSGTGILQSAETAGTGTTGDGKPYSGDTVSITDTAAGTYNSKNVADATTVTYSGLSLTGAQSGNYTLTIQSPANATITKKALTASGMSVTTKTYDGTQTAALTGTAGLTGSSTSATDGKYIGTENVSLTGTASGQFADKNASSGKTVTISGLSLAGTDAGNYTLSTYTAQGEITAKALTVSGLSSASKVYDGITTAAVSGTAVLQTKIDAGTGSSTDGKAYNGDTVSLSGTATGAFNSKDVASANKVSFTGLSLTGADAGNYTLTQHTDDTTARITAKALTMSGLSVPSSKVYDGTTAAVVSGTPALQTAETAGTGTTADGKPYTNDTVSITGTAAGTYNSKNVADATTVTYSGLSLTGAQSGNYTLTIQSPANATITKKALTASGMSVTTKTYDGTKSASLTGTAGLTGSSSSATDGKYLGSEIVSLTGTAGGEFDTKNAGSSKTVTISGLSLSGTDKDNYTLSTYTAQGEITAKALTVSGLSSASKVYDATTTAAVSGTAILQDKIGAGTGSSTDGKAYNGDTVSLGGTATGAFNSKDVASANKVSFTGLSLTGADAGNYTLTQHADDTTARITAKALTMSGLSVPASKTYDGTTVAVVSGTPALQTAEAAGTGTTADGKPYTGDTVSITGTAAGTYNSKNVTDATTVTYSGLSLTGAQSGNYTLTIQSPANATITAKALTVSGTVTAENKVYDGNTNAVVNGSGASLNGIIGSETVSFSTGGTFSDKNVGTGKTVDVTLTGADAGNYSLSYSTTADITPRTLVLSSGSVTAANKTYDGTRNAAVTAQSPSFSNVVSGDTVGVGTTGTFSNKDAVTGKTVAVTLTGGDSGNYQYSTTADITPKALTMNGLSVPTSKTYDGTTTAVVSGTPSLQTDEAAGTGTTADGKPYTNDTVSITGTAAGTYNSKNVADATTVTYSGLSLNGAQSGNYTLTIQSSANATITKKALSVTGFTASDKVYDGNRTATIAGTMTNKVSGDALTLTGTFDTKNVGDGKTVTGGLSGDDAGNYSLGNTTTTAKITPLALSVTGFTASDKVYDGTTAATVKAGGAKLSNVIDGDKVNLETKDASGTFDTKNVGTGKKVSVTGLSLKGADKDNYTLGNFSVTADITPATLTITSNPASRSQGQSNPAFSGSVSGFVSGENEKNATDGTLSFTTTATTSSGAGSYPITGGGLTAKNGNYTFVQATGNDKALTVTGDDEKQKAAVKHSNDAGDNNKPNAPQPNSTPGNPGPATNIIDTSAVAKQPAAPAANPTGGGNNASAQTGSSSANPPGGNNTTAQTGPGSANPAGAPNAGPNTNNVDTAPKLTVTPAGDAPRSVSLAVSGDTVTMQVSSFSGSGATQPVVKPLAVMTVDAQGPKLAGSYNLAVSGNALSLSNAAPGTVASIPSAPAESAATTRFAISTAGGVEAEFTVSYAGGAVAIKPINEAAAAMNLKDTTIRKTVTATGILVTQEKLGVSVNSVEAVYLQQ